MNNDIFPYIGKSPISELEPLDVAGLLHAIDHYRGIFVVRSVLKLSPLVILRPKELADAEWPELDLENKVWVLPISRMKATTELKKILAAAQSTS